MEPLIYSGIVLVLLLLTWLLVMIKNRLDNIDRILRDQQQHTARLSKLVESRQSDLRSRKRGPGEVPAVDARARTTTRDSDDLPLTGRTVTLPKMTRRRGGEKVE